MPPTNNPAARLAAILKQLKAANSSANTKQVLMPILQSADDSEFAIAFGHLVALPQQIQEAVRAKADPEYDDIDWHLQWVPPVGNALAAAWSFNSTVQGVQRQYEDHDIVYLEACGNLLSKARIEPVISPEQLQDLRAKVHALQEDLTNAEGIPADLKSYMLKHLEKVLRALREFAIRGPKALEEVLDEAVGEFVRHGFAGRDVEPETRSRMEKFKGVLGTIALTLGVAAAVLALPGEAVSTINTLNGKPPAAEQAHSTTAVSPVQPSTPAGGKTAR